MMPQVVALAGSVILLGGGGPRNRVGCGGLKHRNTQTYTTLCEKAHLLDKFSPAAGCQTARYSRQTFAVKGNKRKSVNAEISE